MDNRADLSPEVEAAVRAGRMGGQLLGVTWRRCLLEALDDIGVGEDEHAAKVAMVLGCWHVAHPGDKPAKSQIWYRRYRAWQRAAMGLNAPAKTKGKFDGGLGPKRSRARDYDGPGEISPDAARSWV